MTLARTARRKLLTDRFAELLESWGSPHTADRARELLDAVDAAGFTLPAALDDPPPLTGTTLPDDSPGRREFRAAMAALADRPRRADTPAPSA